MIPHCSVPLAKRSPNSEPPSDTRKSGAPNGRIQHATNALHTVAARALASLIQIWRLEPWSTMLTNGWVTPANSR
eukprot:6681329-Pyramimonas_sp.AAC.1